MRIEAESNNIWKKQRYGLFYEFYHKPFFPPPIILIDYAMEIVGIILKLIVVFIMDTEYAIKFSEYSIVKRIFRKKRTGFGKILVTVTNIKCLTKDVENLLATFSIRIRER